MIVDGKVAVVTGGTKGIGFAIAESLIKAGAAVFICGRSESELDEAIGNLLKLGKAAGTVCDVRVEKQVEQMIGAASAAFGGVDILVNNAGMGIFGKTVEQLSGDEFRQTLETNLFGVFYACHYAVPLMKLRGDGYIINISSLAGQNAHPKMAAYNASKFALNGFTEALMQEVRQDGIRVSYICPGSVNTYFGGKTPTDAKSWRLQPDDVAQAVMDMLSTNARALTSKIEIRPSNPPMPADK
jgi:3-oxoacyl-[acyl-carrier protein] reductase